MLKIFKIGLLFMVGYFLLNSNMIDHSLITKLRDIFNKFVLFVRDWLKTLEVYINTHDITLSQLLTFSIILIGVLYILVHLLEAVINLFKHKSHPNYRELGAKHKSKSLFYSLVHMKLFLILMQVILLITQAYSISEFLEFVFEKPTDFLQIVKNDSLFLLVLGIILILSLIGKKNQSRSNPIYTQNIGR